MRDHPPILRIPSTVPRPVKVMPVTLIHRSSSPSVERTRLCQLLLW